MTSLASHVLMVYVTLLLLVFSYHGGDSHELNVETMRMGIAIEGCDTGKANLTKDFDPANEIEYKCPGEMFKPNSQILTNEETVSLTAKELSICQARLGEILHICMQYEIFYPETPPLSGPHRHVWPEYGEYFFIPPQRWVHGIEHGAVALLYHPCADPREVDVLRQLVVSCKRRHIITPYRNLTKERPLALVSWGCKLEMGKPNLKMARAFIKRFSINANEKRTMYGEPWVVFEEGLVKRARIVDGAYSQDALVCPDDDDVRRELPIENKYVEKKEPNQRREAVRRFWQTLGLQK